MRGETSLRLLLAFGLFAAASCVVDEYTPPNATSSSTGTGGTSAGEGGAGQTSTGEGGAGEGGAGQGGGGGVAPSGPVVTPFTGAADDTALDEAVLDIAEGKDNEVYIVGVRDGVVSPDGTSTGQLLFSQRNSAGEWVSWADKFAVGAESFLLAEAVAVADNGDVVIGGVFQGNVEVSTGKYQANETDGFVARLNQNGVPLWFVPIGGSGAQRVRDVAVGSGDQVFLTGQAQGALQLGGSPEMPVEGETDGFIEALSGNGAPVWWQYVKGGGGQAGLGVRGVGDGHVIVTGAYGGDTTLEGLSADEFSGVNIYLARLDQDGHTIWAKTFGGLGTQLPTSLAVSPAGEIAISGMFGGFLDFGLGNHTSTETDPDVWDSFLAMFDGNGAPIRDTVYANTGSQVLMDVAFDPAGNLLLAGVFTETLKVGSTVLKTSGATDADAFVAKVSNGDFQSPQFAVKLWGQGSQQVAYAVTGSNGTVRAGGAFTGQLNKGSDILLTTQDGADGFYVELSP